MSGEQPRTDANGRERSPDHQYSLSIEQTAELHSQPLAFRAPDRSRSAFSIIHAKYNPVMVAKINFREIAA
jgi:hypothetical protein